MSDTSKKGTGLLFASTLFMVPNLYATAADNATEKDITVVAGRQESVAAPLKGIVAKQSAVGTKTETPLVKTPQAISVVTRDQMDAQGATSIQEALRYTSGVVAEYRGSSNRFDEVLIRGFRYAPKYLDGLSFGDSSKMNAWLLERAEVIHGPASVVYGQAKPGGLVMMTSKRPTAENIRKVQFSAGNQRYGEAAFDFGGAVNDDANLLFRLNGVASTKNSFVKDYKEQAFAIAPALTFIPNEDTTFTLLTSYQKEPKAGYRNFLPAIGTRVASSAGYIPQDFNVSDPNFNQSWREQAAIGYSLSHYINEVFSFQQNLRFASTEERYKYLVFMKSTTPDTLLSRRPQREQVKSKDLGIDNQLKAEFATGEIDHSMVAGLDYRWRDVDSKLWRGSTSGYDIDWTHPVYGLNIDAGALPLATSTRKKLDQLGLYLQDQLSYGGWNMTLSGRYDWSENRTQDRVESTLSQQNDTAFTGRAGLLYAFDSGISPYVSYSTSFEPNLDTGAPGSDPFKPTKGEQTEVGVKYQPKGTEMMMSLALFDLTQKNVTSFNSTTKYNEQIGKIRSKGLEAEVHAQVTPAFNLIASYTYTDIINKETNSADELDKTPPAIPTHAASLWGSYSFRDSLLQGFTTGVGVRYTGTSYANSTNTAKVPAFTLYDWMARYELGEVSPALKGAAVQVNVNNLSNKKYIASCSNDCFYGNGRTAFATLSYSW
ncbi:Ferric hydroxamate uptake [Serratia ficaria]|uniref:TonB-dependent siderophore receptor n=1 Tax=Serratia ficaria TaxID=61651 RepID=UPI0021833DCF|nr:TonB-dependent siderophore receptor [Serratia ficaria]CAI2532159.1 Ferric hydroxamate uptake [Serratia ficaria]